ncbi:MAG: MerR family transcriptional regulator [Coprobacillaceae bacterium]
MRTHEVESLLGVSKQTILFYEKEGLLKPSRDNNGYRNYQDEDIQVLKLIKLLRSMDISLDDIKLVLNKELSFQECLRINEDELEDTIESIKDIQKTVSYLKEKNLPIIPALSDVDVISSPLIKIGYYKTNKTVSLGRKLTKGLALRIIISNLVSSILISGIIIFVKDRGYFGVITILQMLCLIIVFFILSMLAGFQMSAFHMDMSKNKYIEFLEDGVCYYEYDGLFRNAGYLWSVLFNKEARYLKRCSYEDIKSVKIRKNLRFMKIPATNLPIEMPCYDFWFTFKDNLLYLYNPMRIDDDSHLVAIILKEKIKTIIDPKHALEDLLAE